MAKMDEKTKRQLEEKRRERKDADVAGLVAMYGKDGSGKTVRTIKKPTKKK